MDRCLKRECQDMPRKAGGFLLHVCSVRTFCLGLFRQSFSSPWLLYHEQDLSITKQIMRNSCSRKTYINCHPGSQNRPRPKALSASGRTVALLRILKGAWGLLGLAWNSNTMSVAIRQKAVLPAETSRAVTRNRPSRD